MISVLTGDIIDSSSYSTNMLDTTLNTINNEFDQLKDQYSATFKLFKGDSFQGVVAQPENALKVSLFLKTVINKIPNANKGSNMLDVRMAIGVGNIALKRASILESNGEAFQYSGRTLDNMKGDYPRLLLKTSDENINNEFNVHFSFLDSVTSKWSRESAEVVYYLLRNYKEREIAAQLGITQSAVNQRKKAANWDSISMLLKRYESVINYFINGE